MKILFVAAGSPATVFGLTPLAHAVRTAGHHVFMAATREMMPVVAGTGLTALPVASRSMREYFATDREGRPLELPDHLPGELRYTGRGFGRLAAASLDALTALAESWRPDLVVGGALSFAAPLFAARLGVPYVRHAWDLGEPPEIDRHAAEELAPELRRAGLAELPAPDLRIDLCPPSLAPADAPPARTMRYVPCALQKPLEPWMYTRGDRLRVCVTTGSRVSLDHEVEHLRELVDRVAQPGTEVVVAAPEEVAAKLGTAAGRVRAGWIPLDVVLPTCDLLVHHAGGSTALTGIAAGVPQLLLPDLHKMVEPSVRHAGSGAALLVHRDEATPSRVAEACRELLHDPSYRRRAHALAEEYAALPAPSRLVPVLEELAGRPGGFSAPTSDRPAGFAPAR
ncbi:MULTISPECIES: nucleotide disphospho-sugar-binding domain-containing protein [unclassified Streptomyces]|uniref:nucleotide disphospho-sugar-binding domain-containing protein n=1 Tax=unclassified Streptomyces TaxID=2593676 RepID=UPI002E78E1C0|nr:MULTISPECIES: nucleotide disphospho-sugar-binding domain-containing protein [unclassified Streptomyces]MEE1758247.1 DUF1205 domain-containing protein [Streptomyces sp. SP18BB07]MEE1832697.1 DUF1205 domain-containing protein [Streptomyces sp. SP17KL33]